MHTCLTDTLNAADVATLVSFPVRLMGPRAISSSSLPVSVTSLAELLEGPETGLLAVCAGCRPAGHAPQCAPARRSNAADGRARQAVHPALSRPHLRDRHQQRAAGPAAGCVPCADRPAPLTLHWHSHAGRLVKLLAMCCCNMVLVEYAPQPRMAARMSRRCLGASQV